jgi:DNA-binding response OmpR family regulator
MQANRAAILTYDPAPPTVAASKAAKVDRPIQVLLVEDDSDSAAWVRVHLTKNQQELFNVEWCPNLMGAMNRLVEPGVDVVLLDLGMPELSGHRTYRAVKFAAGDKVPIVIFTADERNVSRDMTLSFGASDYLAKDSTSPAQLRQALHTAVLRRPSDESGSAESA